MKILVVVAIIQVRPLKTELGKVSVKVQRIRGSRLRHLLLPSRGGSVSCRPTHGYTPGCWDISSEATVPTYWGNSVGARLGGNNRWWMRQSAGEYLRHLCYGTVSETAKVWVLFGGLKVQSNPAREGTGMCESAGDEPCRSRLSSLSKCLERGWW